MIRPSGIALMALIEVGPLPSHRDWEKLYLQALAGENIKFVGRHKPSQGDNEGAVVMFLGTQL